MYPLVVLFFVGSSFNEFQTTFKFSFPFVILGLFMALYHNLIHYNIIEESLSPCIEGVSCSTVYIEWMGFITIPFLSFTAFLIMAILLLFEKRGLVNVKEK